MHTRYRALCTSFGVLPAGLCISVLTVHVAFLYLFPWGVCMSPPPRARLASAISNGDLAATSAVLATQPLTNADMDEGGIRPLHMAASMGRIEIVRRLAFSSM
jgi:hypothetical protein